MNFTFLWLALLNSAFGHSSHDSLQSPHSSPAGVTYVDGTASPDIVAGPRYHARVQNVGTSSTHNPELGRIQSQDVHPVPCNHQHASARPVSARYSSAVKTARYSVDRDPLSFQVVSTTPATVIHRPKVTIVRQESARQQAEKNIPAANLKTLSTSLRGSYVVEASPANEAAYSAQSSTRFPYNYNGVGSTVRIFNSTVFPTPSVHSSSAAPTVYSNSVNSLQPVQFPSNGYVSVQSPRVSLVQSGGHNAPVRQPLESDHHQGAITKHINVAQPAIKTSRYEVRRPAIQKKFYDIEERIVVRPAGTVVVELDHPISKTSKGEEIRDVGEKVEHYAENIPHGASVQIGTPSNHGIVAQASQHQQNLNIQGSSSVSVQGSADNSNEFNSNQHLSSTQSSSSVSPTTPEPFIISTSSATYDDDSVVVDARAGSPQEFNKYESSNESYGFVSQSPRQLVHYQQDNNDHQPATPVRCSTACQRQLKGDYRQEPQTKDYYKEQPRSRDYYREEPRSKDYYREEPQSKDYYREQPRSKDYYREEPRSKDYYREEPQSKDYYREHPRSKDYYREEPRSKDYYREEPQSKDYYREQPRSKDYYREESRTKDYYREQPQSKDYYREEPSSHDHGQVRQYQSQYSQSSNYQEPSQYQRTQYSQSRAYHPRGGVQYLNPNIQYRPFEEIQFHNNDAEEVQARVTQIHENDFKKGRLSSQLRATSVPVMVAIGEPDFRYPPYSQSRDETDLSATEKSKGNYRQGDNVHQVEQSSFSQVRGQYAESSEASNEYAQDAEFTSNGEGANQKKYLNLLLARSGVSEVSANIENAGESGYVRSRVISATPAPKDAQPADERVHTRRIVVSQPLETVQEVEVQEPFTKYQQVVVNQPAVYHAAQRVDHSAAPIYNRHLSPIYQPVAVNYHGVH